jgi:tetratricopeptide (TPR) repeat protein
MGFFDRFRKNKKAEDKTVQETKSNSIIGRKFNPLQCVTCGSNQLKKIRQGEYVCQHCGNRYLTDNQDIITEATEKELLDAFYKSAEYRNKGDAANELKVLLDYRDKAWDNIDYVLKLGRAYRHAGMNAKAIECYDRAKELNPKDAIIYINIGAIYLLEKMFDRAVPLFEKGIALIEENPIVYTKDDRNVSYAEYGAALAGSGRVEEGEEYIKKAEANGYKDGDKMRALGGLPLSGSKLKPQAKPENKPESQPRNDLDETFIRPRSRIVQLVPERFLQGVNQLIVDFKSLSDEEMIGKYDLTEIWFNPEDYADAKRVDKDILGFLIVNYLVDQGYIIQLDWKDEDEAPDYLNGQENYWNRDDLKVVSFDLDNDQIYLAKVPNDVEPKGFYGVRVKDYTYEGE